MYKCMYSLCMHVPYVCKCALASVCYPDFKGTRYYSEASVATGIESVCGDMCIIENEKFFELKSRGYKDGIKRKETR